MSEPISPTFIRDRSKARGEPAWLVEARAEAFEAYRKLDKPLWRRTDLSDVDFEALAAKAFLGDAPDAKLTTPRQEGLIHMPLVQAAREHEDLVRPLLTLHPRADKWEALQAAMWTTGSLLHVAKGKEIPDPVSIAHPYPATGASVRDLYVLEPLSKASVVARQSAGAPGALMLHGIDLVLRDGANLSLSTVQETDHGATLLNTRRANLLRDSRLTWVDGQFGGARSVTLNENHLNGPGANIHFIGAFFGSGKQHLDITTAAYHHAPNTSSQLDMKGALTESGYSANYSIVNIGEKAGNSSGHQHQETLLLSPKARADAIPKLDVENNDVSASHGATVGQVDPDQLFYLRARGFSELGAKRMIVEGFFEPLLSKIPLEDVQAEIRAALVERLQG